MFCQLKDARKTFFNNTTYPRCIVVADGRSVDIPSIVSRFDVEGWAVTWLDVTSVVEQDILAILSAILNDVDIVYLVMQSGKESLLDIGYVFGLSKTEHRPVFIDYRGDSTRDDYPTMFKMADGIGFGADDLSLFIDMFSTYTELSDYMTRARAVANRIKRIRVN
jgi:hypothetical protein